MIELYIMQEKSDRKIFICNVSAYNTHPDFGPNFRRKKCVLYAENYCIIITIQSEKKPMFTFKQIVNISTQSDAINRSDEYAIACYMWDLNVLF